VVRSLLGGPIAIQKQTHPFIRANANHYKIEKKPAFAGFF